MNRDIQQAKRLDAFVTARLSEPETMTDDRMDGDAKMAAELIKLAEGAQPDPAFVQKLEAQLRDAARQLSYAVDGSAAPGSEKRGQTDSYRRPAPQAPTPTFLRSLGRPAFALGTCILIAVAALLLMVSRTPVADAQVIFKQAQAAASAPAGSDIQSFELHETSITRTSTGETWHTSAVRWFQAPDRWRVEIQSTVTGADGKPLPERSSASLSITDGTTVWYLDEKQNSVTITPLPANGANSANTTAFGPQPQSLTALLAQASSCFDPRVLQNDTVAGRAAYMIDLGTMKCSEATSPADSGRTVIWVDQQTFFVLKATRYGPNGSEPVETTEVTSVTYNHSLDTGLFTFVAPAGVTIQDLRPKPAPTENQYQQQLQQLASQAAFPVFGPDYVPAGLAPRQPRNSSIGGIELDYVPSADVDKASATILSGLLIDEQPATYDLIVKWTASAKPVQVSTGQAWVRSDAPNPIGGGMDRAAYVLRDGTLISIASFAVDPTELIKVASSLQTVNGSHVPLPNPTAPVLATVRQRVGFPVLVPTNVPAGLVAEPPLGGDKPDSNVEINYHNADGRIALTIVSGPPGCCTELSAVKGEQIKLASGAIAHLILDPGDTGSWTLWWEQEGTLATLSGPDMARTDLIKIAGSVSKTADLGTVQAPPVRPAPGPLPAPKFKILQPSWLPEVMTSQQDLQKAPPEFGSWVALTFLPKSGEMPRTPLILLEKPQQFAALYSSVAQGTKQKIGRYDVTVTATAKECMTYDWVVGDVRLSLSNSYNGTGNARYTCDQMVKIVESIR